MEEKFATGELTDRESQVLNTIVRDYVMSAAPASSRAISKHSGLELSPASIRLVLTDLEEKGFVTQPHTSAGRTPTDRGYRYYVDHLLEITDLSAEEKEAIEKDIENPSGGFDDLAAGASKSLASHGKEIGLVLAPKFEDGVFKRLDILEVGEKRALIVLSIVSGLVNSIVIEFSTPHNALILTEAAAFISTRLAGRRLAFIRDHWEQVLRADDVRTLEIVRIVLGHMDRLFSFSQSKILHTDGTSKLLSQPEFLEKERLSAIVEILESKEMLIHLLDKRDPKAGVVVTIGGENKEGKFQSYSLVTASYNVGDVAGTLGVIGPTRMPYPKLISLVDYTAQVLSKKLEGETR